MTTPTIIHKYQNGNCLVTLCLDGTKIREWPDNEEPVAEYPESIDIKCTNKCDGGCTWCHERSTIHGIHAKVDDIMCLVDVDEKLLPQPELSDLYYKAMGHPVPEDSNAGWLVMPNAVTCQHCKVEFNTYGELLKKEIDEVEYEEDQFEI